MIRAIAIILLVLWALGLITLAQARGGRVAMSTLGAALLTWHPRRGEGRSRHRFVLPGTRS